MFQRWENHQEVIPVQPDTIRSVCDAAGKDGWELVGMLPIQVQPIQGLLVPGQQLPPQSAVLLCFKRPVGWEAPDEQEAREELAEVGA